MNCRRPTIPNLFVIVILAVATLATVTACSSIVDEPERPSRRDREQRETQPDRSSGAIVRDTGGAAAKARAPVEPTELATERRSVFGRGGGSGRTFVDLLDLIPDAPDARARVELNNYQLAQEVLEIPVESMNDYNALWSYYGGFAGPRDSPGPALLSGPFSSGYSDYSFGNPNIGFFGFHLRDMTQSVITGLHPARLEIMVGEFDPDDVDRRIQACSDCPAAETERHGGVTFYSWGEDVETSLISRFNPPAFDQVGRGGRIAVMPNLVFRTVETPGMRDLIDARQRATSTLSEVDEFRRIAQSLDRAGAYSAFITDDVGPLDFDAWIDGQIALSGYAASSKEALRIQVYDGGATLLQPYLAFGVGAGMHGAEQFMALVLAHDDAESASRNEELLESQLRTGSSVLTGAAWAEIYDIDDIDSRVTGSILTVKVTGSFGAYSWIDWYYNQDTLLLYE